MLLPATDHFLFLFARAGHVYMRGCVVYVLVYVFMLKVSELVGSKFIETALV